jgi:hypothetical protein
MASVYYEQSPCVRITAQSHDFIYISLGLGLEG